jgi:dTDP-glucose 4,6-dehydratase
MKGKKVLVTGAAGFIGSHLAEGLVKSGAHVRAFVHYNSAGSRGWLDGSEYRGDIEFIHGDLRDQGSVERGVEGCDAVFHLGALIGIPYSYEAPEAYVQTNVVGTLNILKACMRCEVRRLLNTSTSEVYGTAIFTPITEEHPLQGQSPYSASKIGADKLVESFHKSFGLDAVTVRPFNTFGPRQSARAVIPTIISQMLAGKRSIRLGSTTPRRDLNYVANTVDAFILAATKEGIAGQTIHFGSNRDVSIGELFEIIRGLIGYDVEIESDPTRVRPDKSEVGLLLADNSKALSLLEWKPKVTLEEGLSRMIEWARKNGEHYRVDEYAV